ncbi:MAG TPA: DNA repair protein RecN, partial [Terracidiphilus sp.]
DRDEILKTLRAAVTQASQSYRKHAAALSAERKTAAAKLAKQAETQINSLAMKVKFEVAVAAADSESGWTAAGWDTVEYRIATNAGEPLKPLHEIASGGEMSRVMLALKVAVEEASSKTKKKLPTPRTLVFDEIDIGIGGRAAEAVGHKLKALSRGQQVLCVTHLPQIAAFATQHLAVEKKEDHGRTKTQIRVLDDRARTYEVARMLSGAKVTDTSLQHAAQMIASSR